MRDLNDGNEANASSLPLLPANAHIHLPPNFSAFNSVEQAVSLASGEGVRVLGASNYYDYAVYRPFAQTAVERGVFPVFGLEIITLVDELVQAGVKVNDPGNPGKFYVCGKAITRFDPLTSEAENLLATIRQNDSTRMARMVERLNNVFAEAGCPLDLFEARIKADIAQKYDCPVEWVFLQERHVAEAFQAALFAKRDGAKRAETLQNVLQAAPKSPDNAGAVQSEIRSHLMKAGRPAYVPETFVGFDHAYRLILALGGVPCYPTLADGANPVCAYEADPDALVAALLARGVYAAEFIPLRNTPDTLSRYVRAMRQAGIVVTAGTEHNTPDLIPLIPTCLNKEPIPNDIAQIFWEGACVLVAHQFETANNRPGFVNETGLPWGGADSETRIGHFARIGEQVLSRFAQRFPTGTD